MDYTTLTTFIGSVGFPIFMCLLMYKELGELRETIEANTRVIQKLCNKLGVDDE